MIGSTDGWRSTGLDHLPGDERERVFYGYDAKNWEDNW